MIEYENLAKLNKPFFESFENSFKTTLEKGFYILGDNVADFEKQFSTYCQSSFCLGVASGLDALILSLQAFDFPKGSEVIVPANTFIATILAILQNGLKPVLVEPDIKTYNIDPDKIIQKITNKTKAIIIVHLYGKCCQMDKITDICNNYNLKLIEDSAQSHGAKYKNKVAGSFGDIAAFSFYPTKNLGAIGDGGAITTNDENLYHIIKKLRNYGSEVKYYNELIGYNSRLDEVQAGFLSIKLKKLDQMNAHKRKLAQIYLENLKDEFILPVKDENYFDVYHIFNIRHPKRDQLKKYLLDNGVKTEIHYPIPPHKQQALKDFFVNEHYPISEEIHQTTLSLPISYFHTEETIHQVINIINKF